MTDMPPLADDPADQVARAVAELYPRLWREGLRAIVISLFTLGLSAAVITLIFERQIDDPEGQQKLAGYVALTAFVVIVAAWKWAVHTQEELVMPILAGAVGLTHGKLAGTFVARLPKRLLPSPAERQGEDWVTGRLATHMIEMAEVKVDTGGKSPRGLFQGVVAQFPNRRPMPAFFLARADLTSPGPLGGASLSTEGLHHLRDLPVGDGVLGLWAFTSTGPDPIALSAVVDVLTGIESQLGPGFRLYSSMSNGEEMHVALTHKRNLFRVRGLIPSRDRLYAEVQAALQDLNVPLTLARLLIEAEARVTQND